MAGVHGERLFGKVDNVPGQYYVSTMFWHVQYLPLVPLGSYLVIEGSEHGDQFSAVKLPWQWKSVCVGLLRGWLGWVATVSVALGAYILADFFGPSDAKLFLNFAIAGFAGWCVFKLATADRPWRPTAQTCFHAVSLALYLGWIFLVPINPARPHEKEQKSNAWTFIAVANGALLALSMSRVWTVAKPERMAELAALVEGEPAVSQHHQPDYVSP